MEIKENIPLKDYSAMRVGGPARFLVHVQSKEDLFEALAFAKDKGLKIHVVGHGTNTLFTDEGFDGLVIINRIKGFDILEENDDGALLIIGAGEDWDDVVEKSIDMGLSGIEALSMVPGAAGAAPITNIGCYGQEISETLKELTAYDLENEELVLLSNKECAFRYRGSRFSQEDKDRFIILNITLQLKKGSMKPPFYKDVEKYFAEREIEDYSPAKIREALIYIRSHKLPDPAKIGTLGSFFKNPVVSKEEFEEIEKRVPEINHAKPQWPQPPRWFLSDGMVKIAAARLIELVGFDGYEDSDTGMALWPNQNLVLVNKGASSAGDVIAFKNMIKDAVRDKFGVDLEEEVETVE